MTWQDVLLKVAQGVAVGATVGGGSMILNDHLENATQRAQIAALTVTVNRVDALRDEMAKLSGNMAVLNARLEERRDRPSHQ